MSSKESPMALEFEKMNQVLKDVNVVFQDHGLNQLQAITFCATYLHKGLVVAIKQKALHAPGAVQYVANIAVQVGNEAIKMREMTAPGLASFFVNLAKLTADQLNIGKD